MRQPSYLCAVAKTVSPLSIAIRVTPRPPSAIYIPYSSPHASQPSSIFAPTQKGTTGLVKQAYSAFVTSPDSGRRRKLHLTAYFTYADLPHLPNLDSEPIISSIPIPQGVYRSGKSRTSARNLVQSAEPPRSTTFTTRPTTGSDTTSASDSPSSSPQSNYSMHLSPWTSPGSSASSLHTPLQSRPGSLTHLSYPGVNVSCSHPVNELQHH